MKVVLEQLDDRAIGGRGSIGDRAALEDEPLGSAQLMVELPHQSRLSDARLTDEGHDLPLPCRGLAERCAEPVKLLVAADEPREPARDARVPASARRARAEELEREYGFAEAFHAEQAEWPHADKALRKAMGVRRKQDGSGRRELLHACGEERRLAHGGIVHPEIVSDRPHDDVTRVEPDADLDLEATRRTHLHVSPSDRRLDRERCEARAHGVVFVCERRAEEGHDPIAHHLIDGALVPMDGIHHQLEDRVEKYPSLLRIAVLQEFHRTPEVGEQDGDLLALTLQRTAARQDALGEIGGRESARRRLARDCCRSRRA